MTAIELLHYSPLYFAYAVAALCWVIALRYQPSLWPKRGPATFAHPWIEVLWALAACAAVVGLGQLYQRGLRLRGVGPLEPLAEAINHALIFSPVFLLLILRRQGLSTVWLPTNRVLTRIAIGIGLAWIALLAFTFAKPGRDNWFHLLGQVYQWRHFDHLAQVFFEDVAIALLMVRLVAAIRRPWLAGLIVGFLFAAAHVPAMLTNGVAPREMLSLVFDFVLAAGLLLVVQRSGDIWWFWCVHFALDMTQPGL